MKKHITRLLFAALLLLALCIGASAAGTSGKCGPSAYWSFDSSTGTLTISGSGAMNDYEYGDYPWMDYRDSIQTIVIGDQITQIGRYAFTGTACSTIKFGKNVRSIGERAFLECRNLNGDLTLPDSVQTIGAGAFQGCEKLSGDLTIPDSVQTIGDSAFEFCTGLNGTLTLGKNLRTIGKAAFSGCAFTGSLTIPEGVTEIANGTFSSSRSNGMFTGTLTLPSTLKTIGAEAFAYTDFSGELLIPDGVTSIGAHAFKECDGFGGTLSLPDSIKTVGERAFYLCKGFTGLKLSASLTKIEERSFAHMYGLKTEVVIPEGVTEIGEGAFSCSHMPSVRFPSTLKKIGKQAFYLTFGLTNYSTITFPNGLEVIEDEAFDSCYFKNAVVLPASIKSIGKKCSTAISIPESVTISPSACTSSAMRPRLSGRGMPTARSRRTGRSITCPARPTGRAIPTRATRSPRGTAKHAGTTCVRVSLDTVGITRGTRSKRHGASTRTPERSP